MKTARTLTLALLLFAALVSGVAQARIVFGASDFNVSDFKNLDKVTATCKAADPSFLCRLQDATLTRIPTKGVDLFFDGAGELVAAYAKPQKGQTYNDYPIDRRQNLIPFGSGVPGGAVFIDGAYDVPQDASGSWQRIGKTELVGTFHFRAGAYQVERVVTVSAVREHINVQVSVQPAQGAGAAAGTAALPRRRHVR